MQLSITVPIIFTFAAFASAAPTFIISQRQDEQIQFVADLINQLNEDIVHTTQFFEAFPTLSGSALITQASAALTALQDAIGVVGTIVQELPDNAMTQVIKGELLDNDFLLDISLQFQDFAEGINWYIQARDLPASLLMNIDLPSDPFPDTLGLYCSDAIPEINNLFQIAGSFVDDGITISALPPNNCPN